MEYNRRPSSRQIRDRCLHRFRAPLPEKSRAVTDIHERMAVARHLKPLRLLVSSATETCVRTSFTSRSVNLPQSPRNRPSLPILPIRSLAASLDSENLGPRVVTEFVIVEDGESWAGEDICALAFCALPALPTVPTVPAAPVRLRDCGVREGGVREGGVREDGVRAE